MNRYAESEEMKLKPTLLNYLECIKILRKLLLNNETPEQPEIYFLLSIIFMSMI